MDDQIPDKIRLRPHHVYCERFAPWDFPERGGEFNRIESMVRTVLGSGTGTLIEVVEGTDDVCRVCPLRKGSRCESPNGSEEEVRKWDAIVLRESGMSYGNIIAAGRLRELLNIKAPLPFCNTRCKNRTICPGAKGRKRL